LFSGCRDSLRNGAPTVGKNGGFVGEQNVIMLIKPMSIIFMY